MEDKGRKPTYDIDDILLEAQRLKENRKKGEGVAPSRLETVLPIPEKKTPAAPTEELLMFPAQSEPAEKRRGRFFHRRREAEDTYLDMSLAPEPAPVKTPVPRSVPPVTPPGSRPSPLPNAPAEPPKPVPVKTPVPRSVPPVTPPGSRPSPLPNAPAEPPKPVPAKTAAAKSTVLLPEEDDVRIYTPPTRPSIMPPPAAIPPVSAKPVDESATRLVELPAGVKTVTKPTVKPLPRQPETDEMEGQLKMDDYVGEEQQEGESDEDWEERLRRTRQEKVKAFRLLRGDKGDGFKLSGEDEEVNDPAEEPDDFEDEELEDYSSYEESEAVQNELTYRRRTGWITLVLTGVAELVLVFLTLMSFFSVKPPMDIHLYISIHAFLLGVMMLINHQMVGGGLGNALRLQADADGAVSAASLFALLHTLLQFFNTAAVAEGTAPLFTAAAGLGLLLGAVGRQMRLSRISGNFRFVSHPADKYAARRVDDPQTAVEIGRSAVALGEPEVAYFKKAGFLQNFLANSYGDDGSDRAMRAYVPLAFLASVLLGVGVALLGKAGPWEAAAIGVGAFCLSSPAAALMVSNFPLLRAARRTLRKGAMLIGWDAVQEFGSLHAIAVDAQELFPSEDVLLHGIKTFSGARIDRALLDAAAVSIAAGGPLSGVFRRVIENKTDMLPPVDTLVYEQDMGLSGWVSGRRVLVGNRRLLENHGVDVPSRDYENRYAKGERRLVYLSTAGELSAMFVVSYVADEGIRQSLHDLQKTGITLLVRTCDPNVTEQLVCDTFELDSYYTEIMGVTAGRAYERLVSRQEAEEPDAVLASNGRVEGMAAAVTSCRRLRTGVGAAVAVQIIGAALGFALSAFLAFATGRALPPLYMLGWLLGWSVLSWLPPLFRKV